MNRPDLSEMSAWDSIRVESLPEDQQLEFKSRRNAIRHVGTGYTVAAAGKKYNVNPKTLASTISKALEIAPDGRPWGWRACVPYRVRIQRPLDSTDLPTKAGPGAFQRLLRIVPKLEQLLVDYAGPLPKRYLPAPPFERLFATWKKFAKELVPADRYPRIAPDFARRSCIEFVKSQREGAPFIDEGFEVADAIEASQLAEVFELPATTWTQYDGHSKDCEFYIEGEGKDGKPYLQKITKAWLLVGYDATGRLINSWRLSLSTNYSGVDFNQLCGNELLDWEPRDLIVPNMRYVPGGGIGTWPAIGVTATACIHSCDNAMAHRLRVNRQKMGESLLGVINFGRAAVPEARGLLEAFFSRIEECAVRLLPGGFRPDPEHEQATRTNKQDPKKYPVIVEAMHDLMDVILSAANATSITAHQNRSPLEFVRSYAQAGGWFFHTSNQTDRSRNLSREVVTVTITGNRKRKRQPFVRFKYGRYRSPSLNGRWDLLRRSFAADYDISDMRYLTLYDEKGEIFVILRALRPWNRTPHSLDLRKIIHRCVKHGKFEIKGAADAVGCYSQYLRKMFAESQVAATEIARFQATFDQVKTPSDVQKEGPSPAQNGALGMTSVASPNKLFVPLGGPVSLGKRRPR